MTKNQRYLSIVEQCKVDFEDMKNYLLRINAEKSYIEFDSWEGNKFKFRVGQNEVLFTYTVNLKDFSRAFKTQEIILNKEDYGKHKLVDIDSLTFKYDNDKECFFISEGKTIDFPNNYFNLIEKYFEERL